MPVLLVWLFIAVLPVTSSAVTTVAQSGHLIRVWQTEDGLPQNTVNAITQTRDGFIWVGTLAGLARFDGLHFQVFDEVNAPGLSDEGISSLYEDTQGTLWIGHESGDVTCYRNSRFTPFSKGSPVSGRISQITEDDKGAIWLFRQNGTLERVGQFPAVILPSPDSALKTLALVRSPQGRIWVRIEGIASELKQGTIHPMDFGPAHHTNYVRGLGASNDGGLWVVCDSIVRKWKDEHWTEERGTWGNSDISTIKELHNGILAIGTMESGFHLRYPNGKTLTFDYQHGLIQNWVHLLYEDREGNLWVAAGSGGLVMIRPTPFETLNAPDNWQGRTVLSVTPGKEGDLWIGTEGAGLYNHHEGKWKHYSAAEGISRPYVWSLATNSSGQVWAGTWDGDILHLEGEHFLRTPELDPVGSPVMTLHFDAVDGSLWAGTRNGLLHWKNGEKSWHLRDPTGNQPKIVFGVFPDGRDNLWLALADAGVGYLHAGESKVHELNGGWTAGSVQCLLVDGNTLWIGTQNNGLSRLKDGHITSISANQGLASRVICHMEDDGKGYLWLSTHHGIIRVAKSELNRCADGEITTVISQTFDKDDGLPTIEYRRGLQAGCQTADGRIWFTSSKGLVSVDPGALISNTQPPPS